MNTSLHQINISYVPEQDRLLLRASTNEQHEYRIWLTRRFSALILQILDKQINNAGGMQKIASEQETLSQLKQGVFDKNYLEDTASKFPLGEDGVLGYQINSGTNQQGKLTIQLLPQQGEGLNLTLNDSLLYLLHTLLEQAILQADWSLRTPSSQKAALH